MFLSQNTEKESKTKTMKQWAEIIVDWKTGVLFDLENPLFSQTSREYLL